MGDNHGDNKKIIYTLITITTLIIVISSSVNIYTNKVQRNDSQESRTASTNGSMLFHASERTEYGDFTGRWFGEGNGNISFAMSSGEFEPNSEVTVSLKALSGEKARLNREVKFQLTERDENDKLLKVVTEEKQYIDIITSVTYKEYFSTILPNQENCHYMLSTEIVGEDGKAEDTVVTRIYVPEVVD